jgi:hypothetical protein
MRGILMSIRTTSGAIRVARAIASAPSAASPMTEMSSRRQGACGNQRSLAHPEQAEAARGWRPRRGPVVGYVDLDNPALAAQRYLHPVRPGVLEYVGQAFLDDAVGRQVEAQWDGGQVAVRPYVHFDACLTNLGHQVTQTAQPGLRRERGRAVALAQQSEQPAQLGHGLPAAQLDRLERDVVQLTGDSRPLGLDGTGGPGFLVTL